MNIYKSTTSNINTYPENNLLYYDDLEADINNFILSEECGLQRDNINLTICIIYNSKELHNKKFLYSLRYIKCKKIIISSQEFKSEDKEFLENLLEVKYFYYNNNLRNNCDILNFALDRIGDESINNGWVLLINEFERVSNDNLIKIVNITSRPYKLDGIISDIYMDNRVISKDIRLYKYNKDFRYTNDSMPTIYPAICYFCGEEGIKESDVWIDYKVTISDR